MDKKNEDIKKGEVKWFDPKKGFGFVVNEQGKDVFVHYTSIVGEGFKCLRNGEIVEFEALNSETGLKATRVIICEAKPSKGKADGSTSSTGLKK